MSLKDKIRDILLDIEVEGYRLGAWNLTEEDAESFSNAIERLTTLLQESNEEAVRGFVRWLNSYGSYTDNQGNNLIGSSTEYLSTKSDGNPIAKAQEEMYENIKQNETPELDEDRVMRIIENLAEMKQNALDVKPQDNIELKREFEEKFVSDDGEYQWGDDANGYVITPDDVWNFFSPHLKDDNKIRLEPNQKVYNLMQEMLIKSGDTFMKWFEAEGVKQLEEYLKKEER